MVVFPERGLAHGGLAVLDRSGFLIPQITPQHGSANNEGSKEESAES